MGSTKVDPPLVQISSEVPSVWLMGAGVPGVTGKFSSPSGTDTGCGGVELPWSVDMLRARFAGLLGDVRVRRVAGRDILALGGYGTASGD